jgi:hypothetical protein
MNYRTVKGYDAIMVEYHSQKWVELLKEGWTTWTVIQLKDRETGTMKDYAKMIREN